MHVQRTAMPHSLRWTCAAVSVSYCSRDGNTGEADSVLEPLHDDLCVLYGLNRKDRSRPMVL